MSATTSSPTGSPTDPLAVYRARADRFADVLDGVDDRWAAPTPCEGWSVREVVDHVVGTERDFLGRHDLLPDAGPDADPDGGADPGADPGVDTGVDAGADPAAAWRQHAAHVVAVLGRDGVAARSFDGYFGPTTIGAVLADFYAWDLVVHGWDVARATGQDYPVADEEVAALAAGADGWGDALYSEGVCAAPVEVPDDAAPFDRLLGRLGRDPGWTPGS